MQIVRSDTNGIKLNPTLGVLTYGSTGTWAWKVQAIHLTFDTIYGTLTLVRQTNAVCATATADIPTQPNGLTLNTLRRVHRPHP